MSPSITLAVTAKYPIEGLGVLTRSAVSFVDEIVIVKDAMARWDGYSDFVHDKLVLAPVGATILDMRNLGLAQCTKDWVLWLDCDENLNWWLWANLRRIITEQPATCDLIQLPKYNCCVDEHGQFLPYSWKMQEVNWAPVLHRRGPVTWAGNPWHCGPTGHRGDTKLPANMAHAILHFKTAKQVVESDRKFHEQSKDGFVPPNYEV